MLNSSTYLTHRLDPIRGYHSVCQSELGNDGNKVVLCIPQGSSITRPLTIRLLSVINRTLVDGESYLSAEIQSMYSKV